MSTAQSWVLVGALLLIVIALGALTLYVVATIVNQRADELSSAFTKYQIGVETRSSTLELQRAAIETRLAAIETRLTILTPTISLLESKAERSQ